MLTVNELLAMSESEIIIKIIELTNYNDIVNCVIANLEKSEKKGRGEMGGESEN